MIRPTPAAIDPQVSEPVEAVAPVALNATNREIDASPHVGLPEGDPAPAASAGETGLPAAASPSDVVPSADASAALAQSDLPLITVEQATQRLGPVVLAALSNQFNGSLTEVRYSDQNDILF